MARPIWKGHISFGLVNVPITLMPAEQRTELSFHLLDNRDKARIKFKRVNEITGEEVPWDQIVKGYEYNGGSYVLLSDEDFKKAAVEASQTIEIQDFVDRKAVDYVFFEKPYYLVPGKKGEKGYVLLRETLRRTDKVGIAKVVIRTKQYLAALIAEGDALVLDLLRFNDELRNPSEYELPTGKMSDFKVSEGEIKMAEKLVEAMVNDWQPEKYKDDYQEALMNWIEEKIKSGKTEEIPEVEEEGEEEGAEIIDMMALLKKSLGEEKNRKATQGKAKSSSQKPARRKVG